MGLFNKTLRKLKYFFGKRNVDFDGDRILDQIPNENIPEIIMERNVALYNMGYDKNRGLFVVIVRPLENEVEV